MVQVREGERQPHAEGCGSSRRSVWVPATPLRELLREARSLPVL